MSNKELLLFGSGYYGKLLLKSVDKGRVAGFIDNDSSKWGKKIEGLPVYSLEEILDRVHDYDIIISVSP